MPSTPQQDFVILLVDDRSENIISLEEILAKENRRILKAGSGNEALKQVLKNEDIGLIMLDVQMPDMDGFEVAHILKANAKTKDIAIIFVTAISTDEQYVLKGFEEGAVDYLQKPLDVNITRAKVNVFERLYFTEFHLRQSLSEVERINKQLERFVFIVSHDLKSPLASISMLADLLQHDERVAAEAELSDHVGTIAHAANRLGEMIGSILEYSRQSLSQQTIEEVNCQVLVSEIIELLFVPKNFSIHIDKSLPTLPTRKIKLQQVLQNLISNSVKYNDKKDAQLEIGAVDKGRWYEFYVKDNGPGIAKKDHSRIFHIFETAESNSLRDSSTGLGLNLLKVLVEEQGGKIWVDSTLGEGSVFYFEWVKQAGL
ncbi:MAG: chemotaxis regulator - transmits chemoreceptor signals to flagelllar motor component cheY [Sediminibacterium sp.]|nr:chemotaxis regulator - transmits chemoreceptor signals to flagelllar motor component cheY [Sediminibacterium sp.]